MSNRDSKFWKAISAIPLVGRLREVPTEALREARSEIVTTTIFASMPFWFPFVAWIVMEEPPALLAGFRNGELLIYAATLVGPLAYIITRRYGRYQTPEEDGYPTQPLSYAFPYGRLAVTIAMVICIISGFIITLQKVEGINSLRGIKLIDGTGLAILSITIFVISTLLLYCVAAYRNLMDSLSDDHSDKISRAQQEGENDLEGQWRERRDQANIDP